MASTDRSRRKPMPLHAKRRIAGDRCFSGPGRDRCAMPIPAGARSRPRARKRKGPPSGVAVLG